MSAHFDGEGLSPVSETLLIPLVARAEAGDTQAAEAVKRLGTTPGRFSRDRYGMRAVTLRSRWFDRTAVQVLARSGEALVLNLGAGLDDRARRIGAQHLYGLDWIDLDLPEVLALRTLAAPDAAPIRSTPADLRDPGAWVPSLPWRPKRPIVVLAEGVLMYLTATDVERLIGELAAKAEVLGCPLDLAFDYASPLMAATSWIHPSIRATGARFSWGLRRPHDLTAWAPGLRIVDHYDIGRRLGLAPAVASAGYRLATGGRRIYACAHCRVGQVPG